MTDILDFLIVNWYFFVIAFVAITYLSSGLHVVSEWERVPVMRFGKYVKTLEPGFTWMEPFSNHTLDPVDIREGVNEYDMAEGTSLQTHDNVPISFVTILTSKVTADNVKAHILAADGKGIIPMRTLAAVSEVVSATELNTLLHERAKVCDAIEALLTERIGPWGTTVVAVEIRDVKITDESIQEAIAMKARAGKEAEAEMVRAEAQVAISQELSKAAKELTPEGWRLKGMEVMTEMTRSAENNTVVIPSDIIQGLAQVMGKK